MYSSAASTKDWIPSVREGTQTGREEYTSEDQQRGVDGIKKSNLLLLVILSHPISVGAFHKQRASEKTHTYDIYLKFLYIYIKLCLFS